MQRGLVRKLDELNRVVIPKEMIKTLNWPYRPNVEVTLFGEWVFVQLADGKNVVPQKVPKNNPVQIKLIKEIRKLSERNTVLLLEMAEALNNVSAGIPGEGTSISG